MSASETLENPANTVFLPVMLQDVGALSDGGWTLGSLGNIALPSLVASQRPSQHVAKEWGQVRGTNQGMMVHFELPSPVIASIHWAAGGGTTDRANAGGFAEIDAAGWAVIVDAAATRRVDVATGFVLDEREREPWLPWFDRRGVDRLVAEFGDGTAQALSTILEATTDHYELRPGKPIDWTRPWLRGACLRLAAMSGGNHAELVRSIEVLNTDMRDLYS